MSQTYAVVAVATVVLATVLVGGFGLRISRTTSDFYVASRTVGPGLNAAAISGEYLSAASFLGIAGLVLVQGPDMLWYPVGYTAGYLVLLLFVAAPLRRSGAYTLPDFAEGRLESRAVRRLVSVFVVGAGWLYLVPQLQGAGLTLKILTGAPGWLGPVLVAAVVVLAVAAGGMRSITFVQAFQYWLKLTALLVPVFFLVLAWQGDGAPRPVYDEPAALRQQQTVRFADPLTLRLTEPLARPHQRHRRRPPPRRRAADAPRGRAPRRGRHPARPRRQGPASPAAPPAPTTRCTRRTGSSWRRSSAPWACPMSSSASTPARAAARPAGPPSSCSP